MEKITLVISSLGSGGSERVMATLANAWASAGVLVTLITLADNIEDHYQLLPSIRRVRLPFSIAPRKSFLSALGENLQRAYALRKAIQSAGSGRTISFLDRTNVLALLATVGLAENIFVSERAATRATAATLGFPWRSLRRILYRRAHRVIVQTAASAREIEGAGIATCPAVVPNPLPPEILRVPLAQNESPPPLLVAMGRLSHQKGFDLLIKAFSTVALSNSQARLIIWGDGPERARLLELIRASGLDHRITMPGITHEPWAELSKATVFVLSSRFEGFPNVLLEAMALGRPCIAFDCPHGPREMSSGGRDLLLVENENSAALAEAILALLNNTQLRRDLGARAFAIRDRFSTTAVLQLWDNILRCETATP